MRPHLLFLTLLTGLVSTRW